VLPWKLANENNSLSRTKQVKQQTKTILRSLWNRLRTIDCYLLSLFEVCYCVFEDLGASMQRNKSKHRQSQ